MAQMTFCRDKDGVIVRATTALGVKKLYAIGCKILFAISGRNLSFVDIHDNCILANEYLRGKDINKVSIKE
jgi:hypothetical protein